MNACSLGRQDTVSATADGDLDIPKLNGAALRSLVKLFDGKKQLFCHHMVQARKGFLRKGVSPRGTVVALLGLHRLAETGARHPFDFETIERTLFQNLDWIDGVGDLGVLSWFAALYAPSHLERLYRRYDFETALVSYLNARRADTKHLAWFLAGLAHAKLTQSKALPNLTDLAVETYHKLQDNQGENGIFSHRGPGKYLGRWALGRFGTFADQTHSIYALSKFAQAFHVEEPLGVAMDCVGAICGMQGPLGQWWCLYDSRTGRLVSRYPVFSRHQDGTLPMALFALENASGLTFREPIHKGLAWVYGANAWGADFGDPNGAFIGDSIGRKTQRAKFWERALDFVGIWSHVRNSGLEIRFKVQPEHFGWLLYAFGNFGL
jgi:hypothetical protein